MVRVGILGAAGIVRTTWQAIHRAGLVVTYIGCRDADRATKLATECTSVLGIEKLPRVGSYEDVVTSPDVDVVYIPIPVTQREEWVKKCIDNNKHVVGEKPAAESADQLKGWIEGLHAKQLLYMDGTMFSHGTRIAKIREAVNTLGGARRVDIACSFLGAGDFCNTDIRMNPALEPMGALGDLGWYCVRVILHVVDFNLPASVSGRIAKQSANGAIEAFHGNLQFGETPNDWIDARFYCSFTSGAEQRVTITCADGVIKYENLITPTFEAPPSFTIRKSKWEQEAMVYTAELDETVVEATEEGPGATYQVTQLWKDVASAVHKDEAGRLVTAAEGAGLSWGRAAWATQLVCDKLLESAINNAKASQPAS